MQYGLIGEHLSHSYSKLIQERMVENYTYNLHPIPKDEIDTFMKEKDFKAINVTIPYKQTVIPYIDVLDDSAKKIGAVNTIVNKNGTLYGYNTDYYGFDYMLIKHNIDVKDKVVLVLGSGGASKAIQAVLNDRGAKELLLTGRTRRNDVLLIEDVYQRAQDIEVIVNTTPCGMYPNVHGIACDLSKFINCTDVLDAIYNPMDTEFTLQAKEMGMHHSVSGLEMLVGQAKKALEYFKDIEINDALIDVIYREILEDTANLVIVDNDCTPYKEIATSLKKEFLPVTKENVLDVTILSSKFLVVSKEIYAEYAREFKRNSFVVSGNNKEEIIYNFKQAVQAYNN